MSFACSGAQSNRNEAEWEWIESTAAAAVTHALVAALRRYGYTWIRFNTCNEMSIEFNSCLNYCIICWMSADNNSFARWQLLVTLTQYSWQIFVDSTTTKSALHNDVGKQFKMQAKRKEKSKQFFTLSPSHFHRGDDFIRFCAFAHFTYYYLRCANSRGWVKEISFFWSRVSHVKWHSRRERAQRKPLFNFEDI